MRPVRASAMRLVVRDALALAKQLVGDGDVHLFAHSQGAAVATFALFEELGKASEVGANRPGQGVGHESIGHLSEDSSQARLPLDAVGEPGAPLGRLELAGGRELQLAADGGVGRQSIRLEGGHL